MGLLDIFRKKEDFPEDFLKNAKRDSNIVQDGVLDLQTDIGNVHVDHCLSSFIHDGNCTYDDSTVFNDNKAVDSYSRKDNALTAFDIRDLQMKSYKNYSLSC